MPIAGTKKRYSQGNHIKNNLSLCLTLLEKTSEHEG